MEHLVTYAYKLILNATKALAIKMGMQDPDSHYVFVLLNGLLKYPYSLILPVLVIFSVTWLVTERIRIAQNRLFDEGRLALFNGKHGRRRILLAVNGVVFDITAKAHKCPAILRGRGVAHPAGVVARLVMKKLRQKFRIVGHQYDYKPLTELSQEASEFLQYAVNRMTVDDMSPALAELVGRKTSKRQEYGKQQQEESERKQEVVKEQDNDEHPLEEADAVTSQLDVTFENDNFGEDQSVFVLTEEQLKAEERKNERTKFITMRRPWRLRTPLRKRNEELKAGQPTGNQKTTK